MDIKFENEKTLLQGVVEDANGILYALATIANPTNGYGVVFKSLDDGKTWTQFRLLKESSGQSAIYSSLHITAENDLLVAGQLGDSAILKRIHLQP